MFVVQVENELEIMASIFLNFSIVLLFIRALLSAVSPALDWLREARRRGTQQNLIRLREKEGKVRALEQISNQLIWLFVSDAEEEILWRK